MSLVIILITFFVILIAWGIYEESHKSDNNSYSQNYTTFNEVTKDFEREQRNKMKRKYMDDLTLREYILKRDNYTCQNCGNSIYLEPSLLLEVDHIKPVSKGGMSIPSNLQTLCWKCNRTKSNK